MIVCSCNVLSDQAIRDAARETPGAKTARVYDCLGCSPQCGRCARTVKKIMNEAMAAACGPNCACHKHQAATAR